MLTSQNHANIIGRGRVAEWLMALVLKTSKLIASQVRILSLPPLNKLDLVPSLFNVRSICNKSQNARFVTSYAAFGSLHTLLQLFLESLQLRHKALDKFLANRHYSGST